MQELPAPHPEVAELKASLQRIHMDTLPQPSAERSGCKAEPGDAQPAPVPTPRGLQAPKEQQQHIRCLEIQHLQGAVMAVRVPPSIPETDPPAALAERCQLYPPHGPDG